MTFSRNAPPVRVSVIVPTFNRATFVREALDSIIGQTYPVHEIIVVDDASTDDTCCIVERIDEPRLKLLRRIENGGGGAARRDGVDAASGDYIAFLDSDDIWAADKIERQIDHLHSTVGEADRSRVIAYTNLQEMSVAGLGRVRNIRGLKEGERVGDYIFLSQQTIQTSTLLVAAPLAKQIQFAPDLLRHQDWDFVLRAERAGAIFSYLDSPLVFLRQTAPEGRVSKQSNAGPSQYWLEKAGAEMMSERARDIFVATEILPRIFSARPLYAMGWIAKRLISGELPRRRALRLFARLVLSERSPTGWKRLLSANG